ncbi:hypothetical protein [Saccharicrinis sp. 156]|uniref:M56 family metallopeptidase n=1 Tax=Saccharicrinis sp. 156 TaxID=3417574 RepID=UPI003D336E0E
MTAFFEFQLKVGGVLALMALIYLLFLSRDTLFQRNRAWLLGNLIVPWMVPLMAMPVQLKEFFFGKEQFVQNTPIQEFVITNYVVNPGVLPAVQAKTMHWQTVQWVLFALVALVLLMKLAIGCFSVLKLRNNSIKSNYKDVRLRLLKNVSIVPFSFFRTIYAPKEIERQKDYQLILEHESAHCKQLHSIDIVLAELVLLFQWWNPFAWWLRKLIAQNHEYCVDSSMLKKMNEPSKYQYLLVNLLSANPCLHLVNSFNGSFTKKRIIMMNKNKSNHILNRLKLIPVFVLLLAGVSAFTNPEKTAVDRYNIQDKPLNEDPSKVFVKVFNDADAAIDSVKQVKVRVVKTLEVDSCKDVEVENSTDEVVSVYGFTASDSIVIHGNNKLGLHGDVDFKVAKAGQPPLVIINGEETTVEVLNHIEAENVEEVIVIKDDEAEKLYGDKGKNDVIIVKKKEFNGDSANVEVQVRKAKNIHANHPVVKLDKGKMGESLLVIINGEEKTVSDLNGYDPSSFESISVLKDASAVKIYGEKAKDGVMIITLKGDDVEHINKYKKEKYIIRAHEKLPMDKSKKNSQVNDKLLYMIDGKIVSQKEVNILDPEKIDKVEVLKGEKAKEEYGNKARHGVVKITTKK